MRSTIIACCTRGLVAMGVAALVGCMAGCGSGGGATGSNDASTGDGSVDGSADARSFPSDGTLGDGEGVDSGGGGVDSSTVDSTTGMTDSGGTDTGTGGTDSGVADAAPEAGCTLPQVMCGGKCTDPATDPFNCGTWGTTCGSGTVCANGECVLNCPSNETLCNVDGGLPAVIPDAGSAPLEAAAPPADAGAGAPSDAGTDDADTADDAGTVIVADAGTPVDAGPPSGMYCASVGNDPNNCGGCGIVCPGGNDTPNCASSVCGIGSCNTGYSNCDNNTNNGCETNTGGDPSNCGSCGNVCSVPNATAACAGGACTVGTCNPGYSNCDGNAANGCETNTGGDVNNCGMCGTVCTEANATAGCASGMCTVASCNTGYANCDGNAANGCEVNTTNDPNNCSTCGTKCTEANGTAVCNTSTCALGPCNAGFYNCDGQYATGCNIDGNTDVNNCGGCNNVCNLPNSTPTCTSGTCTIASCTAGFGNCDGIQSNGCEANLNTSTSNCGACGTVCNEPNATSVCGNGTCQVGSCNAGFQNCDGNATNGCEVNTQTDPNNCGGCGVVCNLANAGAVCMNGTCQVAACDPGFANCDGNPTNGCETNIESDPNNCGMCAAKCSVPNAVAGCGAGMCTIAACDPGFQDCDHLASDGCEIDSNTDPNNCGACNNKCVVANGVAGCGGGSCDIASCASPYQNCGGGYPAGCNINTTNNNNDCGACGNACTANSCGGAADHVAATDCANSACGVTTCVAGYEDFDHQCADGCECQEYNNQLACSSAQTLPDSPLTPGGPSAQVISALIPVATQPESYYTVTFSQNTNKAYHPKIVLTSTAIAGVPEYVMDVAQDCNDTAISNVACTDDGSNGSHDVTTWETSYTNGTGGGVNDYENPIPLVGANGQVWIKVYRNPALPTTEYTCNTFKIQASE